MTRTAFGFALVVAWSFAAGGIARAQSTGVLSGRVEVDRRVAKGERSPVIVYLVGFTESPPNRVANIVQKKRQFIPDLLAITAGQSVGFPNADPHFHNVFSPSPVRPFDLGSFEAGESKQRRFPKPAVVDVYCNIHPEMSATILVLPNRRFATADARGRFRIDGIPPGTWTAYAYSRRAEKPARTEVTIAAGKTTDVELSLTETRTDFGHRNKYGEKYRPGGRYE